MSSASASAASTSSLATVARKSLVVALSLFANRTRDGALSPRRGEDDPLAALADRRPAPEDLWAIVWGLAGFVALAAGAHWGARSGVQFSLTLVVLKAMPVLIIGGFDSIGGAIAGGLIVGATEKLAGKVYVGEVVGGGLENWFPYVVAVGSLLVARGLFGERAIRRI